MLPRTVTHRVTGETITFVETASETSGEHLTLLVELPSNGDGPPLHSHERFVEEFTVQNGTLAVTVDRQKLELGAGDKALVLLGLNHTFTNDSPEPVAFNVRISPPLQFEESVRIHYGLMDDDLTDKNGTPKNPLHLALILHLQDTIIAGVPKGLQSAILRSLVWLGRKTGAYKDLDKYTGAPLQF